MITFLGAVLLAATATTVGNPKVCSPNDEICVVTRRYPRIGDFERVTSEEYWRSDPVEDWLEQYPLQQEKPTPEEPLRGAFYRRWPSGHYELLSEFVFDPQEWDHRSLLTDGGHFVTYVPMRCGAKAELLTIRAPDGSVRKVLARDVVTTNDQQWLCRGSMDDLRWSIPAIDDKKLRATILVTDGKWNDAEARHEVVDVDLTTGAVSRPDGDLCPAALTVAVEALDGNGSALLERAVVRPMPEYPEVATKARIAGRVRVDLVIGADGRVETARIQSMPFGIDAAVTAAIAKWEFAPGASSVSGSMVFRFEIHRHPRLEVRTISCHG